MKNAAYRIFALLFNLFARLCPYKENRVILFSLHNENFCDCLGEIERELKKRGEYEIVRVDRNALFSGAGGIMKFFFICGKQMAQAGYIFLNDNFLPLASMRPKKETKIVQLWHAEGVFKKFGLGSALPEELREAIKRANDKLTAVVCSSKAVAPYYAEAFGVDEKKVLPLGSARADFFFRPEDAARSVSAVEEAFPESRGKKKILYAPTFRDSGDADRELTENFDFDAFLKALPEDTHFFVRLHPQVHAGSLPAGVCDATSYPDVRELIAACGELITDYSSICMDFALTGKKTVFYCPDLEEYTADRDFYFDYESYIPGRCARTMDELIAAAGEPDDEEKRRRFTQFNFDFCDGRSARRICEAIVKSPRI